MKRLDLIGLILFNIQSYAYSSQEPILFLGTNDINAQSSIDFDYIDEYLFGFDGSYSYLIRDNREVGGKLDMFLSNNTDIYQFGAFIEYSFLVDSKWFPYVGNSTPYAYCGAFNHGNDTFNFQAALSTENVYVNDGGYKTQIIFGTRFYF